MVPARMLSFDSNYFQKWTKTNPMKMFRQVATDKGTFLSEDTNVFVLTPNRYFPETENLNFGD